MEGIRKALDALRPSEEPQNTSMGETSRERETARLQVQDLDAIARRAHMAGYSEGSREMRAAAFENEKVVRRLAQREGETLGVLGALGWVRTLLERALGSGDLEPELTLAEVMTELDQVFGSLAREGVHGERGTFGRAVNAVQGVSSGSWS